MLLVTDRVRRPKEARGPFKKYVLWKGGSAQESVGKRARERGSLQRTYVGSRNFQKVNAHSAP